MRTKALCWIVYFCVVSFGSWGAAQRTLITGEQCEIPFVFNGETYTDCLSFGGRDWCFGLDGSFGVCASTEESETTAREEPEEEASAGRVLESDEESSTKECCDLLSGIGFESRLPVMVIDTKGEEIPDEPKIDGTLCICDGSERYVEAAYRIGVEIRGSTSARDFAKKSYAVETQDKTGADLEISLLGFANGSDWVFYGPELDKSMGMRNYLTMELYRSAGKYASNVHYFELFLLDDGRPFARRHYNGVYILMEKIKRSDSRVTIDKLQADEDISGGYIFKYDNNNFDPGDKIFNSTESALRFIVTYPTKDKIESANLAYLSSYIGEVEGALASRNRSVWQEYIDEESFIDMFLITELTKNPDGYRGSYYFYKNTGSVLFAGPPWDFNEAYGMCCGYPIEGYLEGGKSNGKSGGSAISPNGWRYNICTQPKRCIVDPTDGVSSWFRILMMDDRFQNTVKQRWRTLRQGPWSSEIVRSHISTVRTEIEAPLRRNFERWSTEPTVLDEPMTIDLWLGEMSTVESWTTTHLDWIDSALSVNSSPLDPPVSAAG